MAGINMRSLQIMRHRQLNDDEQVLGWGTGCAVISANRFLIADQSRHKLRVANLDDLLIEEEFGVGKPFDITTVSLSEKKFAVTLENGEIQIYNLLVTDLATTLSLPIATIRDDARKACFGVAYNQDHLYVVCKEIVNGEATNSLLKLDMEGNVIKRIPLVKAENRAFRSPKYIALSEDGNALYISDCDANLVARLTLNDGVTDVYIGELNNPCGLVVLEDGSLFVCCKGTHTIHHISGDLRVGRIFANADDIRFPDSVCYHRDRAQIIVSTNDKVKVFDI